MTIAPLFWLGLAAASGAGLLLSLLQLQKRRGELTAAQSEAVAQKTSAALVSERNHALESELAVLHQELSSVKAQLSAQSAILSERDAHHQNQMKWVEPDESDEPVELMIPVKLDGPDEPSETGRTGLVEYTPPAI